MRRTKTPLASCSSKIEGVDVYFLEVNWIRAKFGPHSSDGTFHGDDVIATARPQVSNRSIGKHSACKHPAAFQPSSHPLRFHSPILGDFSS